MKKQILSILLALCIVLCLVPTAAFAADGSGSAAAERSSIPSDLDVGSYKLKIFSEQCNGDKKTDYACEPIGISLTVKKTVAGVTVGGNTTE